MNGETLKMMTEATWQGQVEDLLAIYGWSAYRDPSGQDVGQLRSRISRPGRDSWPGTDRAGTEEDVRQSHSRAGGLDQTIQRCWNIRGVRCQTEPDRLVRRASPTATRTNNTH
jgi:hypothetical protein